MSRNNGRDPPFVRDATELRLIVIWLARRAVGPAPYSWGVCFLRVLSLVPGYGCGPAGPSVSMLFTRTSE
jgi:hypothetical protein